MLSKLTKIVIRDNTVKLSLLSKLTKIVMRDNTVKYHCSQKSKVTKIVMRDNTVKLSLLLKGVCHESFYLIFFHDSNPSNGP